MFPYLQARRPAGHPIPHSRGDVPAAIPAIALGVWQFPTHVGMFLTTRAAIPVTTPIPHSRGDVPLSTSAGMGITCNSPLTWGCSCSGDPETRAVAQFPTHVGMFLTKALADTRKRPIPHSRGDVPYNQLRKLVGAYNSPLTWGCSPASSASNSSLSQFPTHVGMFPNSQASNAWLSTIPHSRGDVPNPDRFLNR